MSDWFDSSDLPAPVTARRRSAVSWMLEGVAWPFDVDAIPVYVAPQRWYVKLWHLVRPRIWDADA